MNELTAGLAGKFWYSKKQRKWMDHTGKSRLFCIIEGNVKEYTELAPYEELIGDPNYLPMFPEDSIFLGEGFFYKSTPA